MPRHPMLVTRMNQHARNPHVLLIRPSEGKTCRLNCKRLKHPDCTHVLPNIRITLGFVHYALLLACLTRWAVNMKTWGLPSCFRKPHVKTLKFFSRNFNMEPEFETVFQQKCFNMGSYGKTFWHWAIKIEGPEWWKASARVGFCVL